MNAWDNVLFIPFYLWVLPGMGFLAQYSLFGYSWIQCKREEFTKGSFGCWQSLVLNHEMRRRWLSFRKVPFAW